MAIKIRKGSALNALNVTPLIDVVFLLLIFFLVATRFAEADRELDVQLPTADALPLTERPNQIFVNIDRSGRIFVDGRTLEVEELHNLLRRAAINNPMSQSVIIRADERVPLRHAVTVMNLCNIVGIQDYSLSTENHN